MKILIKIINVSARTLSRVINGFLSLLVLLVLINTPSANAEISHISQERLIQNDGQSFWQVDVNCTGESSSFVIRQQGSQSSWCTTGSSVETCESSKQDLAEKICNTALLSILKPNRKRQTSVVAKTQARKPSRAQIEAAQRADELNQQLVRKKREAEFNLLVNAQIEVSQKRSKLKEEKAQLLSQEASLTSKISELQSEIEQLQ